MHKYPMGLGSIAKTPIRFQFLVNSLSFSYPLNWPLGQSLVGFYGWKKSHD